MAGTAKPYRAMLLVAFGLIMRLVFLPAHLAHEEHFGVAGCPLSHAADEEGHLSRGHHHEHGHSHSSEHSHEQEGHGHEDQHKHDPHAAFDHYGSDLFAQRISDPSLFIEIPALMAPSSWVYGVYGMTLAASISETGSPPPPLVSLVRPRAPPARA